MKTRSLTYRIESTVRRANFDVTSSFTSSRWWDWSYLREAAFLALTVVFGLQVFRVLLNGLVFYIRDAQGAEPFTPGVYALILFLLAFLAASVHKFLGPRRALVLTGGGLALLRLVEQTVPWPVVDLALTTFGTAFFLLFIPIYIGHARAKGVQGGHLFAVGLLLGIGIDTAIKGAFATLDLSWQPGAVTHVVVAVLVVAHWLLLTAVVRRPVPDFQANGRVLGLAPLVALGPILFLEALLFQNIGQQTSLIDWTQPLVFLWIVVANAVGIVAAMGVLARPGYGAWLSLGALGAIFALLALGERTGVAAAMVTLLGQVALSMSVGMIGVALASGGRVVANIDVAGSDDAPSPAENRADGAGKIGVATVACGLGMLLLLVLNFLYYVNYELDVPGGKSVAPLAAVAFIILSVLAAATVLSRYRPPTPVLAPALASFLVLLIPLGYLAAWEKPEAVRPSGFPVRVMSYNLHQGFDVDGYLALEDLAKTIEEQGPDIVALQEVSRGWVTNGSVDMLVWLSRRLEMPYVWGPAADSVWGNAILSRFPMSNSHNRPMPNNSQLQLKRAFVTAQIDLGDGESLTVIATHLHHLEDEGHLRLPQVKALLQAWNNGPRSIIMGDFNALPGSPEMLLMNEAGLMDAFLAPEEPPTESGDVARSGAGGRGYTAPSDKPFKRIDYIWVSDDLKASNFSLTDSLASDHLGLAVTLAR